MLCAIVCLPVTLEGLSVLDDKFLQDQLRGIDPLRRDPSQTLSQIKAIEGLVQQQPFLLTSKQITDIYTAFSSMSDHRLYALANLASSSFERSVGPKPVLVRKP